MDGFTALADPTRRRILELLGGGERAAGEIAAQFEASAPAISQHLKVLRETGWVRVRADRQRRIYRIEPDALGEVESWIERLRGEWNERLDALERELGAPVGDPEKGHHDG